MRPSYRKRTQPWYGLAAWKRRRRQQLQAEPLCRFCWMRGDVTAATVADHVEPHRGDWDSFISGELQSLCKPCHDGAKARIEAGDTVVGYDIDGYPIELESE